MVIFFERSILPWLSKVVSVNSTMQHAKSWEGRDLKSPSMMLCKHDQACTECIIHIELTCDLCKYIYLFLYNIF